MADLPEGFDLEALLAPIPGDAPQGIDIREDFSATSPYNRLRDARSEARDAERLRDARPDAGDGGQNTVTSATLVRCGVRCASLALKTLAETTKDLEVAAWMTEALVRSHGLAGLTAGAQLMAGLAERYWDGLFPLPDDYGMETRVAPVTGLNGRDGNGSLIQPLYMIVLFNRLGRHAVAYYQYQSVRADLTRSTPSARQQRHRGRRSCRSTTWSRRREPRPRHFATLCARRGRRATPGRRWPTHLGRKSRRRRSFDHGDPRTAGRDHRHRDDLRAALPRRNRGGGQRRPARRRTAAPRRVPAVLAASRCRRAQLASREDALRALGEIANFFRRTEPHSPLSYTLDEAVRRGRMTWPELLAEVVADTDTRNTILNTLGIRPPPPPEATE